VRLGFIRLICVSMTVHMKAVNVSPIENVVYDSPVGVVDGRAAPHNFQL
jgi:hypothetical protein